MELRLNGREIGVTVEKLREYFRSEQGREVDARLMMDALREWLSLRLDALSEDMYETLTTPSRSEAAEFRRIVERREGEIYDFKRVPAQAGEVSVFTGNRPFSFEKLAAMTTYIAARGREVYKTKLNKLLFYSDFVHFYDTGRSISGAKYVHLPYGPVPDRYEGMLAKLAATDAIRVQQGQGFEIIQAEDGPLTDTLSAHERRSLDWVLETFGMLSARDISTQSHREKAYRFTRTGEPIAYEYAKFFEKLPRKPAA